MTLLMQIVGPARVLEVLREVLGPELRGQGFLTVTDFGGSSVNEEIRTARSRAPWGHPGPGGAPAGAGVIPALCRRFAASACAAPLRWLVAVALALCPALFLCARITLRSDFKSLLPPHKPSVYALEGAPERAAE